MIGPIAEAGIPLDMIVHAATPDTGSSDLTLPFHERTCAGNGGNRGTAKQIGYASLLPTMRSPKSASSASASVPTRSSQRNVRRLADRKINLLAVSTSEIKVSALIAEAELEFAVRVLHSAFGLDPRREQHERRGLIAEPRAMHGPVGHPRLKELMHRGIEFLGCQVAIMGGAMSWISERTWSPRFPMPEGLESSPAAPWVRNCSTRKLRKPKRAPTGRSALTSSPCIPN